ncbi:MAG: homoserine dehydrogenase, partial [Thermotaleaceae bacterium]
LMGFGTVGSGIWKILQENREKIVKNCGKEVEVAKILVRDMKKSRNGEIPQELFTDNPKDILEDDSIEILVEVIGGIEPAREYILSGIRSKKHIVTANKALIAIHGEELLEAAKEEKVELYYEASVAGGIPIIHALKESLSANKISSIMGILNGTTNYILSKMTAENLDFETALKEAQEKGYAEADPTSDVESYDAAYKLSILARLAFGTYIRFEDVYREGITKITPIDIEYAKELGYVIKLLGIAKEEEGCVGLKVHPTFVPKAHPLASVGDAFNAVFVKGNAVGDLMFYGRGAGDLPTGSAVVADMISIIKKVDLNKPLYENGMAKNDKKILPIHESKSEYYIRILVKDVPGVFGKIATEFGKKKVSLSSVIQKGREEASVWLVFITHSTSEQQIESALSDIVEIPEVVKLANLIRVEKMD